MGASSRSDHILELSRELLDDLELSRLPSDKLLLKISRLVRLAGSEAAQKFINSEMYGYNIGDPTALQYMSVTGRWTDYEKKQGYWGPLAVQEATITTYEAKIDALKLPNISGDFANVAIQGILIEIGNLTNTLMHLRSVRARVHSHLHAIVTQIYYEREFSAVAETTFEKYKSSIDVLIAQTAGDVLAKIPSVIDRLTSGGDEAVSHALTTCRRIIEAFADAIYPPTDDTLDVGGGNVLKLDAAKHQNRINAYVFQRCSSSSRRQRFRQNLSNLYDRVSTGVHKDVDANEAFALFLNTYLFLGEILQLPAEQPPSN